MKTSICYIALSLVLSFYFKTNCQPPEGQTANQNQYDSDHIKERSKKSHKKADKINKHNNKAQDHANKQAEKNRKEKLNGKKKENDTHQFPH